MKILHEFREPEILNGIYEVRCLVTEAYMGRLTTELHLLRVKFDNEPLSIFYDEYSLDGKSINVTSIRKLEE